MIVDPYSRFRYSIYKILQISSIKQYFKISWLCTQNEHLTPLPRPPIFTRTTISKFYSRTFMCVCDRTDLGGCDRTREFLLPRHSTNKTHKVDVLGSVLDRSTGKLSKVTSWV